MVNSLSYPHRLDNCFAVAHTLHNATAPDLLKIKKSSSGQVETLITEQVETLGAEHLETLSGIGTRTYQLNSLLLGALLLFFHVHFDQ